MKIIFKVLKENNQEVLIINAANNKAIGRIFTPNGTGKDVEKAIQVCGFDEAFDLWGCGVFTNAKNEPKRDIQLLFNEDSRNEGIKTLLDKCSKCYYEMADCRCKDLRVKSLKEVVAEKIGDKK